MPKTILWLASYPKSGNTWLRLFLFNYLFNPDEPAAINQSHRIGPSDATMALYKREAGPRFDAGDRLSVLQLRRNIIARHSANGADVNFMKTHNVNADAHGVKLIPADLTRSAIYIIRDPVDVAVSYANHFSCPYEKAVETLRNPAAVILTEENQTVQQFLGNWSDHVRSWARARDFRTCVIRYEDMQAEPDTAFAKALKFIGAPVDEDRLRKAIRFSSFDEAKKQEQEHGFVEKPKASEAFFRSGRTGDGYKTLPQDLIDRIVADHGETMKRYGYLS